MSSVSDQYRAGKSQVSDHNSAETPDDAAEMAPNREMDAVAMPTQRPLNGAAARQDEVVVTWNTGCWADWQLPILVVLFAGLGVLAVIFVILLWLKNQMLSSSKLKDVEPASLATKSCTPTGAGVEAQWIFHPVMKPLLESVDSSGVQPQQPDRATLPEVMSATEGKKAEPIRIKAKGLLERRGSSASLTIDLHPGSQENLATVVTPTRECTTEEYLLSAGNVLSRGQLRLCLHEARTLHREFWDLPSNHPEKAEVAGSGTKNRYRSILPNERSRVRLPVGNEDLLAGYINANYVRGYDGEERAYIATQGPLPHTVSDFWTMVWAEHPPAIVMITKLWEKGRPKCEAYFPHGEPGTCEATTSYGDITITVRSVTHRDGYIIRELLVQRGNEKHDLMHFWYDTWPDHKTPPSARSLVAMAREVEAVRTNTRSVLVTEGISVNRMSCGGPVVVHCSAGIGRTGCFIAVSVGMLQLLEENKVDILGIVCQMRYDRGGMIQTAEQYEFVHRALCLFERSLPDQSGTGNIQNTSYIGRLNEGVKKEILREDQPATRLLATQDNTNTE
ncbi:tyrosine-protein phosphatase non-receptor type 7 isoform X2 [Cryptotermes secundus]|nr:tyrosine-protein phosphatase non-receptor type 7 isoform X2 [Cryptotermes secundus]XP_023723262.1 tyrosine-protein phosphatase non-receptor type 7 isoform X2 [Cryptotermes secundus]XP_023723263.1 tyrosine-protein phosphatase non-receptor type 7 isoform X2 [Cryptotermes secundus]